MVLKILMSQNLANFFLDFAIVLKLFAFLLFSELRFRITTCQQNFLKSLR